MVSFEVEYKLVGIELFSNVSQRCQGSVLATKASIPVIVGVGVGVVDVVVSIVGCSGCVAGVVHTREVRRRETL